MFIVKHVFCLCESEKVYFKLQSGTVDMKTLAQNLSLMPPQVLRISKLLLKLGCNVPGSNFPGMVRPSVCTDSTADLLNVKLLPGALCFVSRSSLKTPAPYGSQPLVFLL